MYNKLFLLSMILLTGLSVTAQEGRMVVAQISCYSADPGKLIYSGELRLSLELTRTISRSTNGFRVSGYTLEDTFKTTTDCDENSSKRVLSKNEVHLNCATGAAIVLRQNDLCFYERL